MPEKQPDIYKLIWLYFTEFVLLHKTMLCAVLVTGLVAFLKAMSDKKKDTFWSVLTECIFCMLIVGALFYLLDEFNIHEDWIRPIAVGVGYYGTAKIRQISDKFLEKLGITTPSKKEQDDENQ